MPPPYPNKACFHRPLRHASSPSKACRVPPRHMPHRWNTLFHSIDGLDVIAASGYNPSRARTAVPICEQTTQNKIPRSLSPKTGLGSTLAILLENQFFFSMRSEEEGASAGRLYKKGPVRCVFFFYILFLVPSSNPPFCQTLTPRPAERHLPQLDAHRSSACASVAIAPGPEKGRLGRRRQSGGGGTHLLLGFRGGGVVCTRYHAWP